ncbi:MAG: hypothetical protein NZ561_08165 [Phycisphaerae bacterium]|nr:hypothetical protein [Phycisphaerae bacterium]
MQRLLLHLVAVLLLTGLPASADPPATQPQADEREAILEVFRNYNNAMMRLDEQGMDRNNHITTGRERKFANAALETDMIVARLKLAAKERFGEDAAPQVGRALGDIGNEDLADAEVQIMGNRAAVRPAGASAARVMIKVNDVWKFDLNLGRATDEQVDQAIEQMRQRNLRTAALLDDLNAGKFQTLEELLAAIARPE